ncbi:MAG: Type secretion system protein [Planctomycetota bacterium]|jgi:type IV pilus assembly protein PilB
MVALNRLTRKKLGEILVEQNLLTEQQVQDALRIQHQTGMMLGETLVASKLITEEKLVAALAQQFGVPYIKPTAYKIPGELLDIFDAQTMRRFQFVPIDSIGSVLVIAISGVLSEEVLKEIENQTGMTLQIFLTKMSEIQAVLKGRE